MPVTHRVFYAAKRAGIGPEGAKGTANYTQMHGLQSVGMRTTFNLSQTFELGQLSVYEYIEGLPEVSIDVEKVLDGYCPVYVLATGQGTQATDSTLIGRADAKCDFLISVFTDSQTVAGGVSDAEGTGGALQHVLCSGVMVDSVSYSIGIDGYATENVTLVGQHKTWHSAGNAGFSGTGFKAGFISSAGNDAPKSLSTNLNMAGEDYQNDGGVQTREDVLLGPNGTTLPSDIVGVNNEGKVVMNPDGNFHVHLQSLSFSVDMGREQIFELGRRGLYHRYVPFPVQVNAEIGVLSQSGDLIEAHSDRGIDRSAYPIQLIMREGLVVDLGSQNRLSSVNVTGGDVGG